ncbi:Histone methyltransferase MYST1 [Giardia lamblia P15]|uniref:histone acetyltransferase n=1 Tax=Giardia intestinalis (strain P15) TaxID=658858 RepID=E1EX08_GIAIA|nr:Histone methyltransferase MYST1 [Giardia lamblia P15]
MRFRPPEALFLVGTLVQTRPRGSDVPQKGRIVQIKVVGGPEGLKNQLFSVRFFWVAGPTEAREAKQTSWYRYDELEYLNPPTASKTPLSFEQRTIGEVCMGNMRMVTWYYSPFPPPYTHLPEIFICPFCMRYIRKERTYTAHIQNCSMKRPPGLKIYDDGLLAVYEVDGRLNKLFCQCLCLFTKLFLDSKTLFYDTDIFLFYIMTVRTDVLDEEMNASLQRRENPIVEPICNFRYPTGETIVGYFSKEKCENNILACILTFPCFHRMGIGSLLIDFAYLLGQMENRQAGPEEPLSKLGLLGFTAYWSNKVLEYLLQYTFGINLEELLQTRRSGSMTTLSSESVPVSLDVQSESSMQTFGTEKELTFSPVPSSRGAFEDTKLPKKSEHVDLVYICEQTGLLKKHAIAGLQELPYIRFRNTDSFDITHTNMEKLLQHYLKKESRKVGRLLCHRLRQESLHWEAYTTMYRRRDRIV